MPRLLILAAVVFGAFGLGKTLAAPIVWQVADGGNGHAYDLINVDLTWPNARQAATSLTPPVGYLTGHLVTISDAAEQAFVSTMLAPQIHNNPDGAWFGWTDEQQEGVWRWIDSTPGIWQDPNDFSNPIQTAFEHWAGGEPNGSGSENYGSMRANAQWNDYGTDPNSQYLVEFQPIIEPRSRWSNPLGGSFSVGTNWVGGAPPTPDQPAAFDLSSTYTVTFGSAQANDQLLVRQGNVTFDLGGFTYTLASVGQASVDVANETGSVASLTLTSGTLSAVNSTIGSAAGSNGHVTVGMGATWASIGNVQVGGGTGLLTVISGGGVTVGGTLTATVGGTVTLAGGTLHATTFNVSGGTFNRNSGTLELAGGLLSVTGGGQFSGAFDVENGDSVNVSGAGSAWHSLAAVRVGGAGTGNVAVSSGAAVTNTTSRIGFTAGSHGTVTVDGLGTTWDSSDGIEVGSEVGQGTLTVTGGSHVTSTATSIGELSGANGEVTVSGPGSMLTGSDKIEVGVIGVGEIHVLAGGVVSAATAVVARDAGSTGMVEVTGAGATLSTTGAMYVGGSAVANGGTAALTVTAGGNVTAGTLLKVWQNGSITVNVGTLNYAALEMAGGSLTQATIDTTNRTISGFGAVNGIVTGSGTVTASGGMLTLGDPANAAGVSLTGTLNVGTDAHAVLLDANRADLGTTTLAAGAQITAVNGFNLLAGHTFTATGSATVGSAFTNGGTVNGPVVAGNLLSFTGDVDGTGMFTGNIQFAGGFKGGTSLTPALIAGNATFASTATLRLLVSGAIVIPPGSMIVGGNVTLGGNLDVDLISGIQPALGSSFTVMTFGSRTGDFASYTDTLLSGHLVLKPQFTPNSLVLKARPAVDGDINLDGIVDIFDVNAVSSNWGTAGPQGDVNGDGAVSIFDVNLISANWHATESSATAVPEPSTIALAISAATLLVMRRRSRSSANGRGSPRG